MVAPSAILGPVLSKDFSCSVQVVSRLLNGSAPVIPGLGFSFADVRNVAALHLRAMTSEVAAPLQRGSMPTVCLTCGLPGSAKTTLAKRLQQEAPALRLTADEWLHEVYPDISTPEVVTGPFRGSVERLQWPTADRPRISKRPSPAPPHGATWPA